MLRFPTQHPFSAKAGLVIVALICHSATPASCKDKPKPSEPIKPIGPKNPPPVDPDAPIKPLDPKKPEPADPNAPIKPMPGPGK